MPEEFLYVRSRIFYNDFPNGNGDVFVGIDPSKFVGKPVSLEFREHDANGFIGDVHDAYSESTNTYVDIIASIDSNVAKAVGITVGIENISFGIGGFIPEGGELEITS